jgi:hypothetical protein
MDIVARCSLMAMVGICAVLATFLLVRASKRQKLGYQQSVRMLAATIIALSVVYATRLFADPSAIAAIPEINQRQALGFFYDVQTCGFTLIAIFNLITAALMDIQWRLEGGEEKKK